MRYRGSGSSPLTRGKRTRGTRGSDRAGLIPAHAGKTYRPSHLKLLTRAHPRSRGENRRPLYPAHQGAGSSPLTRGKLGNLEDAALDCGLIPAHAGKTSASARRWSASRAHPRSRGENLAWSSMAFWARGSSPLTRGKHCTLLTTLTASGLIPAHAGKTLVGLPAVGEPGAHPRSRGENALPARGCADAQGSSPLTRGKLDDFELRVRLLGRIPAHAGKTTTGTSHSSKPGAHPRSRGENHLTPRCDAQHTGSSPLTRGKRCLLLHPLVCSGLIPAHAGKTDIQDRTESKRAAHPRSRGENDVKQTPSALSLGSSPLTRGKPRPVGMGTRRNRLIPAHAGKTCTSGGCHFRQWAHPRSRGENHFRSCSPLQRAGSSPLTRGKHNT